MSDKPPFDPNKPFTEVKPPFDPNKPFTSLDPVQAKPEGVSQDSLSAFGRGAAQGASLGFADEMTAGLAASYLKGKELLGLGRPVDFGKEYSSLRDLYRSKDAEASKNGAYLSGQIGGGIASSFLPGMSALNAAKGAGYGTVAAKGALQGGILGAGNAENWTDIPAEVVRGSITGGAAGVAFKGVGDALSYAKDKIPEVVANAYGGVAPKNLKAYLANPERINAAGALPDTAVKDAIDEAVKDAQNYKTSLSDTAKGLEEGINRAYDAKKNELVGAVTPLAKAKELAGSLAAQKEYLSSLSEQADDALSRSGMTFKKSDLLRSIDKIGKGSGPAIGDEAYSALSKLQATRDRIAEQLPDQIPATKMRDVLQQLRKDISFDMGAGEYNDTLNGMRKEFSTNISKALKQNEEYSGYMKRMADLSESLGKMNRYFGDETKALGSLEALRKGGAKAQPIEDTLRNHAVLNGDKSILQSLEELKNSHELLGKMKLGEDLRPTLFPKEWSALQEAVANAKMADHVYTGEQVLEHPLNAIGPSIPSVGNAVENIGKATRLSTEIPALGGISRLSPDRTQSIIKNMGGSNVNIMDRRELENLSNLTGRNYLQQIEDRNVFDSFKKGQTNGSRMSVIGGSLGAALGGATAGAKGAAVGASIGAMAGGALDKYGPYIVKGTIDSAMKLKDLASESGGWKAFGPYAKVLSEAATKGNTQLAFTNQVLLKTDPAYRNLFGTGAHQQGDAKKEAIRNRALGN